MRLELPLFPLNTVLFPGMPINLHIFEERYKTMINKCLDSHQPFGVVLIRHGREAHGPLAVPHPVGCTAQIIQMEALDQGRMAITALGGERFRILTLDDTHHAYLVATVDLDPLIDDDPAGRQAADRALRPLVIHYLRALDEAGLANIDPSRLPEDSLTLAYFAITVLHIPAEQKQALLTAPHAIDLLADLRAVYVREVALLKDLLQAPGGPGGDVGPSLN